MLFLLGLASCKPGGNAVPAKTVDIYVAGSAHGTSANSLASQWKNWTLVVLTNISISSNAMSIVVDCSDVYVAGNMIAADGHFIAVYWKNSIVTKLADSSSDSGASAIAVSGNDIYVAGSGTTGPVYWKNEAMLRLPSADSTQATGIAVNWTDVYVSGFFSDSRGPVANVGIEPGLTAMIYWKNGTLDNPQSAEIVSSNMDIGGIAIAGSDVYVVRNFGNYPDYWKNGNLV